MDRAVFLNGLKHIIGAGGFIHASVPDLIRGKMLVCPDQTGEKETPENKAKEQADHDGSRYRAED